MEKRDFFISYNKADKAWVKWIAGVLEENGYSTYLQAWDIRPGDDFIAKMNEFLENSMGYISVFSQDFKDSPYCQLELSAALDKHLKDPAYLFLLVRAADVTRSDFIRAIVSIDLFGVDEATAKKRLLIAVDQKPIPRKLSPFPGDNVDSPFPGKFPVNNLPDRNPHFIGRADILETIHRQFQTGHAVSLRQTVAGLGGVGKTQTAIEYAYRHANDYDLIWWVNAEKSFKSGLLEFAERLGLIPEGMDMAMQLKDEDIIRRLHHWFDQHNRFLFIFDNVEDFDALRKYLPRNTGQINGHVLITTRNKSSGVGMPVDISVFTLDEAVVFLKEWLQRDEGDDAAKLAGRLDCLPLALELAAAFIQATRSSCRIYLDLLEKHGLKVFDQRAAKVYNYAETVATTCLISFEKIALESAKQLFYLCAWFAPDDIPVAMLIEGRDHLPEPLQTDLADELSLNDVIYELKQYSLLKEKDSLLFIHRLVQEVVRDSLRDNTSFLDTAFRVMGAAIPREYGDAESCNLFRRIAAHALAVAEHFAAEYKDKDDEKQELAAALFFWVGRGHQDVTCQYHLALSAYHCSVAIREKVLGKEHPYTAATYNNIGLVYDDLGDYDKALEWYQKALAIREKVLGKEHPDTAATYNNIAVIYVNLGDYDKALKWYQKALAIDEKVSGKEHPYTAATYNNIGLVYTNQGEYTKALEWYQKALDIDKKVSGKEHPDTAATYNNIGLVYTNQGEYTKALEWYQKALDIREKVLGKEHPDTAATYNNIAIFYQEQANYEQALKWYQKALAIREKVLGEEHPLTATTYNNIASVYLNQGDYPTALGWYQKALTINEKILGVEHPSTAIIYQNIGKMYYAQKKYADALQYLLKASHVQEKKLGLYHPATKKTLSILSDLNAILAPFASLDKQKDIAKTLVKLKEKVDDIQNNILKFDWTKQGAIVCHYTKLSTLPHLLVVESEGKASPQLRLSNMGHLNDPTEGQYLFELLDKVSDNREGHDFRKMFEVQVKTTDGSRAELPLSDVYIISLTSAVDKLPMWTLYGDDSKGCCLVFNKDYFLGQNLCRVYYVKKTAEEKTSDDDGMINAIRQIAGWLKPHIMDMKKNMQLRNEVLRILEKVRFLFKCEDYEYENEVRIIMRSSDKNKIPQVDRSGHGIPRLYLNIDGDILYDEVILGAKVTNPSTIVPFIRNANVPKVSVSSIEYR